MNKYLYIQRTGGGTGASIFIWTPCRGQAQWKSRDQLRTGSGRYMVSSCLFFFFFGRFSDFKNYLTFHCREKFLFSSAFENTELDFFFFFFVEQELSIEVALYLTWKEKLAFTKLQQYLAYSCSKATMWDPSLIFWSNKSTFRQLSVLRQHMAFFFLSCDKNIQMQSLSQYKKKKKRWK